MSLSFDEAFALLTDHPPYGWQRRLHGDLLAGKLPDVVDLPTGLGKTSVIALWLIALASGAKLPRRLIYVVDRRAVVDQASKEAEKVACALDRVIDSGAAPAEWRDHLGLPETRPVLADRTLGTRLPLSTLRGQHRDNRLWLDRPHGAAIVVGTVDMVGSRLLFEGYGVSRGMRPVHAGLIGMDTLLVLDEAHLVPPFQALVEGVTKMATESAVAPLPPPIRRMSQSATRRERTGAKVFALTPDDEAEPLVGARLGAVKHLTFEDGVASQKALAARLAEKAWEYRTGPDGEGGRAVLVFCNSRETAKAVESDLATRLKDKKGPYAKRLGLSELLVGERRFLERAQLTGDGTEANPGSEVFKRFMAGGPADPDGFPAFLIATSAGEVGIDLDADDIVCDLVAWERMVQRLGRVNRRADPGRARIAVIPAPATAKEAEDAVDLERFRAPFDAAVWEPVEPGVWDVSAGRLAKLRVQAERDDDLKQRLEGATTPEPLRPPLTRATVEAWSLTSLETHPGRPKIGPWLRGWDKVEPQTAVVWRRLFPLAGGEASVTKALKDFLEGAPPHVTETLEAPSWRVAAWLRDVVARRIKAERKKRSGGEEEDDPPTPESGDAETESQEGIKPGAAQRPAFEPRHEPVIVALNADRTVEHVYTVGEIGEMRNADALERSLAYGTVIVDARLGGLDGGLLEAGSAKPIATIDSTEWSLPLESTWGRRVQFGKRPKRGQRRQGGERFWKQADFTWTATEGDDPDELWVELWRGPGSQGGDAAIARQAQGLDDHLADTGREAGAISDGLGLGEPWRGLLVAAAEAHDLGKGRDLWQDAMGARRDTGRPYAKTEGGGDGRALNGYRHEFGSVLDVLAAPDRYLPASVLDDRNLKDLALHLIAAHHGHARPTIKPYDPDPKGEPPSRSAAHAQEIALRFARLQRRWGPWGLAWWEALLRAADWAASRKLNEGGADDSPMEARPPPEAQALAGAAQLELALDAPSKGAAHG